MIKKNLNLDCFMGGSSIKTSTDALITAAVNTNIHCRKYTCIVHNIDTGMYINNEYPYIQISSRIFGGSEACKKYFINITVMNKECF